MRDGLEEYQKGADYGVQKENPTSRSQRGHEPRMERGTTLSVQLCRCLSLGLR
jgi:hypothetical protein